MSSHILHPIHISYMRFNPVPDVPHTSLNPCSFQLFDLVYREETLLNVIKSVTRNGRSIVLTAVLALILVYLFSIVGYIFFKDDFILAVDRIPNKTLGKLKYRLLPFPCWNQNACHALPRCQNAWNVFPHSFWITKKNQRWKILSVEDLCTFTCS